MTDRRPSRLRLLPTFALLALAGTGASQAIETTFQYYRFTPTKNFNTTTTTAIQLSEFNFGLRGATVNVNGSTGVGTTVTMTPTGGSNAPTAGEGITKLFDGSVDTKMYSGNRGPFLFNFGAPVTIDSYNFATANDSNDRTPVSWTLEGSNDGTTFVTIDTRTDVTIIDAYKTYQNGWTISGGTAIPVFASFGVTPPTEVPPAYGVASPGTILSGGTTDLSWGITGATAGGIVLNPGAATLADSGTQTLTPGAGLTSYNIAATNASGTSGSTVNLRAVAGTTATFRYVRFTPISLRDNLNSNSIQVGEFEFFAGGTEVDVIQVSPVLGSTPNAGEPPSALNDGDPATKWLDFAKKGVVFDFGESKAFDSYQMVTGNDAIERDPVRWILEGSDDYESWALIDAVVDADYPMPTRRITGTGKLPLSGRTLAWKSDASGAWDTTTANFNPIPGSAATTTYVNGDPVTFGDNSTATTVTLAAPLAPGFIGIYNETAPYTLTGASINGQTSLIKEGAASLTLASANNFTGPIVINEGSLIIQPGSLGPRRVKSALELNAASTLVVPVTQSSARTLAIQNTGGGTVNVATGATFTHYGRVNTSGTLTKSGPGTLRFEDYNTSTSGSSEDMAINEGVVEFSSSYFNKAPLGARTLLLTVNTGATLRTTANDALGGDYIDGNSSVSQIRLIGGTAQFNGFAYFATGFVGEEGRNVLQGGIIEGTAQIEAANSFQANATTNPEQRSTISTLASATTSEIRGTGVMNCNSGHWLLRVAEGDAQDDLLISKVINGTYGIIKEGPGNLLLTSANTYVGTPGVAAGHDLRLPLPDGTTVRAGTLTARNTTGSATGTGTVLVQSGATLAGTGFITGASAIAGTVSPGEGTSAGILTLGNTTLNGTYLCHLGSSATDKLVVNGNLNLTGATLFIAPIGEGATETTYVIASYTGDLTGNFALPVTGMPEGYVLFNNSAAKQIEIKQAVADSYQVWSAGLSDPSADADEDNDGLDNGVEYVLGSDPETSDLDKAPDFSRNESGDLVFVFTRTDRSAYLNPTVEYSTTLGATWDTFAGAVIVPGPGEGVSTVTATLPASLAGPDGKLFARLKVVVP